MNNLNSILIEGNLVKGPESKFTPNGHMVATFSIGSNRSYKSGDEWVKEVSFFDVEAWGKLAEACAAHLSKGRGVRVVGRLKQHRWTNSEGKLFSRVILVAEHIEFKPVKKSDINVEAPCESEPVEA